ncbi:MAG TPA: hypothetical protein VMT54_18025 [Candidatus Cybelea sp.]|nr:hypothetical protein [Candidatus Cybelea sp.]
MADNDDQVVLRDRFEIKPAARLPQFDQGSGPSAALAFSAEDHSQNGRKLFALICPGDLPTRAHNLPERKAPTPLLWPEAYGIVDWPVRTAGGAAVWGRRPALVYAQPVGERLSTADNQPLPRMNEQAITRYILKPAIQVLRELGHLGMAHRAIRPTNIFYAAGNSGEIVFGDCFSTVPGCHQPALFETIENGMANPMGRAAGSQADDLYALGVLLLLLHLGRNTLQGLSDEAVNSAKINFGTFSALVGGEKVSPTMAEMLRGLTSDKASDRWTLRNLDMWMLGQYFNPVLPSLPQRATRPIRFAGGEHMSRPAIANAMVYHWDDAVSFVDSGALESWLKRGFNDEKVGEPLAQIRALAFSYGASSGAKHRTVSRMVAFLGNSLPICYKSVRVHPAALGTMLASVIDNAPVRTEFVELLRGRLPQGWLDHQPKLTSDMMQIRQILEGLEKVIDRSGPGFSVERALYELDHATPCRSELIADYYVTMLKDLLPAIDAALPGAEAGTIPMDRHIAAFIAARTNRPVERDLGQLANVTDQVGYRLAVLRLIATVQRQHGNHDLPRLAEAILSILDPVVEAFHRLRSRDELRDRLRRFAAHADFMQMAELLDDEGPTRRIDVQGFEEAKQSYAALEREAHWLEEGGLTAPARIHASARTSSAITGAFLASAVVAAFAILMVV